jgi:hypothetical protein
VNHPPGSVTLAQRRRAPHGMHSGAKIRTGITLSLPNSPEPFNIGDYRYGY